MEGKKAKGKSWKREREERSRRLHQNETKKETAVAANKPVVEEEKIDKPVEVVETDQQQNVDTEIKTEEIKPTEEEEERLREEELKRFKEEEHKYLLDYVKDAENRFKDRETSRSFNQDVTRPDEKYFSSLDSSLKKNTAYIRKLKNFTATQEESLKKDMKGLNLTKYISEVASAIVEAKLKMTDVPAAVELSCLIHQTYAEFAHHLLENWQKALALKKDEKIQNPSKLRVDLRFYAELINAGVFSHKEGLPLLGSILTVLTTADKEHNNINIILSFCKHCGEDYAGLVPRRLRQLSEEYNVTIPKSKLLSAEKQKNVKQLFKDYCASLCKHLVKDHKELQQFEFQNRKILQTRGELSADRREKMEALYNSYKKLYESSQTFCDTIDEDMPELPSEETLRNEEMSIKLAEGLEREESSNCDAIWDDDETKDFYENLPDLKAFLPSILYKDSAQATITQESDEVLESKLDEEIIEDIDESKKDEPVEVEEPEEPETTTTANNKILMDAFIKHIMNCVSREMIDNAASEFVLSYNTKSNRKRLVRSLFGVQRTRIDLLPFLSRLVATLYPCMPDVATDLAIMLKHDFKYHIRKKDQINIETKIKVVRFIGEMVKFKMYSKVEALFCLKMLLHDFTHHHIEMATNLLEVCGRYLYCCPETHQRTKVYVEQMMRKKSVMALDSRYVTMIENAYYYVAPPEISPAQMKKERPPMHEYIRKLLYHDLTKPTTDKILKQMRKLNWEDNDIFSYTVKCLTNAWHIRYLNISCAASLLAGLTVYQEAVGSQVVDGVLEDIRLGMEMNHPRYNQRRVATVKFLGELYNYRMVESNDIFKVLYSLITFGITYDRNIPSYHDPPDHLFRLRLCCTLLDTCGQYFSSGASKKKLDCFFVYFQRYYWFKKSDPIWTEDDNEFPLGVEYMYRDVLLSLRPRITLCENYEEAEKAMKTLQEELTAMLPTKKQSDDNTTGDGLEPIVETIQEEEEEELSQHQNLAEEFEMSDGEENTSELQDIGANQTFDQFTPSQGEEMLTGESGEFTGGKEDELAPRPKHVEQEDQDFMAEFDRMVSDNIQDRMKESVKIPRHDVVVPVNIKSSSSKKVYEQIIEPQKKDETVNFVLITRKGNKQQLKNLVVPITSELALNQKNREEAERAEKERVKRLTLDINERLEEEDYQEMLNQTQRPATLNLNRERRPKYQHPKGAPDVDLIFGPKKAT